MILAGIATMPFLLTGVGMASYAVKVIVPAIFTAIPHLLTGVLYFRMIISQKEKLHLFLFLSIIIPVIVLKIITLNFLSQISFFNVREPLSLWNALTYSFLEIMIIIGTISGSVVRSRK